jgi:peptide/nickel transport system substrate-binding protein
LGTSLGTVAGTSSGVALGAQASSGTTTTAPTSTTLPTTSTTAPLNIAYDTNGIASYGVGPQPQNWDIHSAGAAAWFFTLQQVLAQVWPSAFEVGPSGPPQLNSSLLTSAVETSSAPQVVVYQISPQAVWSDGTPITYRDFVYNWEAQCGRERFVDTGGQAFTPLDKAGYHDISSVSGSPADPYTVKVAFSSPYADWQALFSYLVPAHVAERVGFDSGFTDPVADLVSGGPYLVSELQQGYSLELVRNARYWGTPANLSAVTYYFVRSPAEMLDALSAGELDVATVLAQPSSWALLQTTRGLARPAVWTSRYEDLDFNEAIAPFSDAVLRAAVMMALDRTTMAASVAGTFGAPPSPVENRVFLPGETGYVDDGSPYDKPAAAAALQFLSRAGYVVGGSRLYTSRGFPVSVSLAVNAGDPVAEELAQQVVGACATIGVSVNVVQSGPAHDPLAGPLSRPGPLPPRWQMAIEVREVPAFPSAVGAWYATGGTANVDGYSSSAMGTLLSEASSAGDAQRAALYDQVDALAWKDLTDVPLVQLPVFVVSRSGLRNLDVGPFLGGIAWDEENWGFLAP